MDLKSRINRHFTDSAHLKLEAMDLLADPLARASERMAQCLMNEGKRRPVMPQVPGQAVEELDRALLAWLKEQIPRMPEPAPTRRPF